MKNLSKEIKNRNGHIWDYFKFYLNIDRFKQKIKKYIVFKKKCEN